MENKKIRGRFPGPLGALGGKGFSREANDLDGANEAAAVLVVDHLVGRGIFFQKLGEERGGVRGLELGSQFIICPGRLTEALEPCLEIQPGAATKDWLFNFRRGRGRQFNKGGRVECIGGINHVD